MQCSEIIKTGTAFWRGDSRSLTERSRNSKHVQGCPIVSIHISNTGSLMKDVIKNSNDLRTRELMVLKAATKLVEVWETRPETPNSSTGEGLSIDHQMLVVKAENGLEEAVDHLRAEQIPRPSQHDLSKQIINFARLHGFEVVYLDLVEILAREES